MPDDQQGIYLIGPHFYCDLGKLEYCLIEHTNLCVWIDATNLRLHIGDIDSQHMWCKFSTNSKLLWVGTWREYEIASWSVANEFVSQQIKLEKWTPQLFHALENPQTRRY